MKWISVKDRLPNNGDYIWIFDSGYVADGAWDSDCGAMRHNYHCSHELYFPEDFSHWILVDDIPKPNEEDSPCCELGALNGCNCFAKFIESSGNVSKELCSSSESSSDSPEWMKQIKRIPKPESD